MNFEPWVDHDKRRGTFVVRWRDAEGRIKRDEYVYHNARKADARKKIVRKLLVDQSIGLGDIFKTVSEAVEEFLQEMSDMNSGRMEVYRPALNRFKAFAKKFHDITEDTVASFHVSLHRDRLSDHSIASYMSVINTWLAWTVKKKYLGKNPYVAESLKVRTPKKIARFFTDKELRDLEAAIRHEEFRAIFRLGYMMGLRPGERLRIQDTDILWDAQRETGELHIPPDETKGNNGRIVPLEKDVYESLPKKTGRLFAAWSERRLKRHFNAARKRAGIEDKVLENGRVIPKTLYWTRHTYAKRFLEAGGSLKVLQVYMGHKSITLTADTYGHLERGNIRVTKVPSIFAEHMRSKLDESGTKTTSQQATVNVVIEPENVQNEAII